MEVIYLMGIKKMLLSAFVKTKTTYFLENNSRIFQRTMDKIVAAGVERYDEKQSERIIIFGL